MEFFRRFGVIMPMYLLAITLLILKPAAVVARDLRPSDHGLSFFPTASADAPTSGNTTAAMKSFFAGASTDGGGIALPEARNVSDPAWRRSDGGSGGDEVKKVFVLASLVCGMAGVVLLVVSGLIFVFRRYKKRRDSSSGSGTSAPPFQLVALSSVHH